MNIIETAQTHHQTSSAGRF